MRWRFGSIRVAVVLLTVGGVVLTGGLPVSCRAPVAEQAGVNCSKPARHACCAVEGGCRCGMHCCNSRTPIRQEPTVPASKAEKSQTAEWLTCVVWEIPLPAKNSLQVRRPSASCVLAAAEWSSLISLHVRLNA
jgi:hypothetical protein